MATDKEGVGLVFYRRGAQAGTLEADWVLNRPASGFFKKGLATGGPKTGYAGSYLVTYFDDKGEPCNPYDLQIQSYGDVFHLSWSRGGETQYEGVGSLSHNMLVAGWGPVPGKSYPEEK